MVHFKGIVQELKELQLSAFSDNSFCNNDCCDCLLWSLLQRWLKLCPIHLEHLEQELKVILFDLSHVMDYKSIYLHYLHCYSNKSKVDTGL